MSETLPPAPPRARGLRLWGLASLVAAAGILLAGCTQSTGPAPTVAAQPPQVPVRRVTGQQIPLRFEFTGHSAASHHVDVRARVGGYLIQAPFTEGAQVEAGTLLFEIDPRPFLAIHAKAEAEVARALAALRLARQDLARAERLAAEDAIAVEELDRRRTDVQTAEAAHAGALAQREAAALDLGFTQVRAPVAGRVGRALVKPGNLVSGGDAGGTLLTTLVAVSPLHVLFTVDEPAYERLTALRAAGRAVRAEVKLGDDDAVLEGPLAYLAPALDARSGTAQAHVVIENTNGRLPAGSFARVALIADSEQPRLLVPETALGARQGSRYLLVLGKDNKLEHRPVLLGERRGDDRVVTGGLADGESIVINGLQRVRPGMTIQPVEASIASK